MRTDRFDLWDEAILVGDKVRLSSMPHPYTVRYGNFEYFGTQRIGVYLESAYQKNPIHVMPLAQAKTLIKITGNGK